MSVWFLNGYSCAGEHVSVESKTLCLPLWQVVFVGGSLCFNMFMSLLPGVCGSDVIHCCFLPGLHHFLKRLRFKCCLWMSGCIFHRCFHCALFSNFPITLFRPLCLFNCWWSQESWSRCRTLPCTEAWSCRLFPGERDGRTAACQCAGYRWTSSVVV